MDFANYSHSDSFTTTITIETRVEKRRTDIASVLSHSFLLGKWCGQAHNDPSTCTVSDVLSFLQYRLDSGSLPSTLKVYVAAIALFHFPQGRQSIDRHTLVVSFLKWSEKIASPTFQDRFTVCPVFQVISLV